MAWKKSELSFPLSRSPAAGTLTVAELQQLAPPI